MPVFQGEGAARRMRRISRFVMPMDQETILGTTPSLVKHLNAYHVDEITVAMGTRTLIDPERGNQIKRVRIFKINPPCATIDEDIQTQNPQPNPASFSGTERNLLQALAWTNSMRKRDIPVEVDLEKVEIELLRIQAALQEI
jgi:hypothetical protein